MSAECIFNDDEFLQAMDSLVPVMIAPVDKFVPSCLLMPVVNEEAWASYNGGASVKELFPVIEGYKPWFGIFSDAKGFALTFLYPKKARKGSRINVICSGYDSGLIPWTHGVEGLVDTWLRDICWAWVYENGVHQ